MANRKEVINPKDQIKFDDALEEFIALDDEVSDVANQNSWRMGEILDKLEPAYGKETLKKFAEAAGRKYGTLRNIRTTYRAWKDYPKKTGRPVFSICETLNAHPKRFDIVIANPEISFRDARKKIQQYNAQIGKTKKPRVKKNSADREAIAAALVLDENKTYEQAAKEAGLDGTVQVVKTAVAKEQGRREAKADPEIDAKTLSMTAQEKLEAAIRQHKKKLDNEFEQRVVDEIKKRIDEIVLPEYNKSYAEYREVIKARKGVMSRATFRKILACLHPDQGMSKEKMNEAFANFQKLELVLCSEKEFPTSGINMPRTYAEMMERKRKVQEERKAKREARV